MLELIEIVENLRKNANLIDGERLTPEYLIRYLKKEGVNISLFEAKQALGEFELEERNPMLHKFYA
jgi:hypothetical protein